jgi:hypothetical protein
MLSNWFGPSDLRQQIYCINYLGPIIIFYIIFNLLFSNNIILFLKNVICDLIVEGCNFL